MKSSSKWFVVACVLVIVAVAACALILRSQMECAGFAGPGVRPEELPEGPAVQGLVRLVAWNIRNFPLDDRPQEPDLGFFRRTNICDVEDVLRGLNAEIFAFAEITDTRRFPPILRRAGGDRRYGIAFSQLGGAHGQHVAIAWDRDRFETVGSPIEISAVTVGNPGLRPALAVTLKEIETSVELTLVSVHLKAAPSGYETRVLQYEALAKWVDEWVSESNNENVVVMGDFNTTGSPEGGLEEELAAIDSALGAAQLRRVANPAGCSEYWEGLGDRDGVQLPSLLDHIFVRGLSSLDANTGVEAWLHCKRFECTEMVSEPGAEDGTFWDVSDHCPLTLDFVLQ
jgi:endonuclease/exonuclease/phosphatase family metal-dependent hydrolase